MISCVLQKPDSTEFFDCEYFDSRHEVFRCDRNNTFCDPERGDGVVIAARRELCPHNHSNLRAPAPAEEVWVLGGTGAASHSNIIPQYLHIILTI